MKENYPLLANRQDNFETYLEKYYDINKDKYRDLAIESWEYFIKTWNATPEIEWFIAHVTDEWVALDRGLQNYLATEVECPEINDDDYRLKVMEFVKIVIYKHWWQVV